MEYYKLVRVLTRRITDKRTLKNYKGGVPYLMMKGIPAPKGKKLASKNKLPYKVVTDTKTEIEPFTAHLSCPVTIGLGDMDISKFPVKIGREGDYILPTLLNPDGQPANSRNHAVLSLEGGKLFMTDISTNGTYSIGIGGKKKLDKEEKYPVTHGSAFIFADGKPIKVKIKKIRSRRSSVKTPITAREKAYADVKPFIPPWETADSARLPHKPEQTLIADTPVNAQAPAQAVGDNKEITDIPEGIYGTSTPDGLNSVQEETIPNEECKDTNDEYGQAESMVLDAPAGELLSPAFESETITPDCKDSAADDEPFLVHDDGKPKKRKKVKKDKSSSGRSYKGKKDKHERYAAIEQRINHDGFYNVVKEADWDDDNKVWINSINYNKLKMAILLLIVTYIGITAFLQINLG